MPESWRKSIESGSPPCSPQTPSFSSGLRLAAEPRAHPHHLPDAGRVERLEGRAVEDLHVDVARQHATLDVVAAEAERGLGEVVGAEREEVGVAGDLVGLEAGARKLDHRPDQVVARGRCSAATRSISPRISSSSRS